jgi:hypothetical protein
MAQKMDWAKSSTRDKVSLYEPVESISDEFESVEFIDSKVGFPVENVIARIKDFRRDFDKSKGDKIKIISIRKSLSLLYKNIKKTGVKITSLETLALNAFVKQFDIQESVLDNNESILKALNVQIGYLYRDIKAEMEELNTENTDHVKKVEELNGEIHKLLDMYISEDTIHSKIPSIIVIKIRKMKSLLENIEDSNELSKFELSISSLENSLKLAKLKIESYKPAAELFSLENFTKDLERFELRLNDKDSGAASFLLNGGSQLFFLRQNFARLDESDKGNSLSERIAEASEKYNEIIKSKYLSIYQGFVKESEPGFNTSTLVDFKSRVGLAINNLRRLKNSNPQLSEFYDDLLSKYSDLKTSIKIGKN